MWRSSDGSALRARFRGYRESSIPQIANKTFLARGRIHALSGITRNLVGREFGIDPVDDIQADELARMSAVHRAEPTASSLSQLEQRIEEAIDSHAQATLHVNVLQAELDAAQANRQISERRLLQLIDLARSQGLDVDNAALPLVPVAEPAAKRRVVADDRFVAGARLREAAVRAALRRGEVRRPVHHGEWLAWLRADGLEPAGKKPENVFLTQIGRSPLVRRAGEPGYYVIDPDLVVELQHQVTQMAAQFALIPPPDQMNMLGDDDRQRRQALRTEIARGERAIQEAWRLLSSEPPPEVRANSDEEWSAQAWLGPSDARDPDHPKDWSVERGVSPETS